ncbi:MAG TPA: type II toxin-antitoxin system VapC family toxin [Longimicrobium sp.]|nr:type II toxin-antitoxin system VapC family toxin [Longimicrobium sp.]
MGPLTSDIPEGSRVLLDSVSIVYYIEHNPRYDAAASEIMHRVYGGDLSAVASVLTMTEILISAYKIGDIRTARQVRSALERMPNLELVDVDAIIADRAAELRAKHNLRTPDAIHVATALESGMDWIVSNDRRLRRVEAEGIRVWLFDDHLDDGTAASSSDT